MPPRMSNSDHLWCCQSAFWPLIWFPKWIWPTEWGLEILWVCSWSAVVQDLEFCVCSKYGIWLKISFLWIKLLGVKPETQLTCETSNKVVSWTSELESSPRTRSDQLGYGQTAGWSLHPGKHGPFFLTSPLNITLPYLKRSLVKAVSKERSCSPSRGASAFLLGSTDADWLCFLNHRVISLPLPGMPVPPHALIDLHLLTPVVFLWPTFPTPQTLLR